MSFVTAMKPARQIVADMVEETLDVFDELMAGEPVASGS